ncbi:MAG: hypothetical protein COA85_11780 [Robiginitomaculum sp.]|nr:MAG: hypothetical protein COA85_11780 [Robiginitomaculum sp.]
MNGFRSKAISIGLHLFEQIRSEIALHIYTWIAILLVFSLLVITAFFLLNRIKQFSTNNVIEKFKGPEPKRERSIKRRIKRMKAFASSVILTIARNAAALVLVGMVLPGIMLGVIVAKQDWIMPGTYALSLNDVPTRGTQFSQRELIVFVADQALKGGLSDAIEVFDIGLGDVRNNPENRWFSALVFLYRLLSGAVVVTIAFVTYRIVIALPDIKMATNTLQKQLEELQSQRVARTG